MSTQEEIDALGGSKSISVWEARFELAYQKCKDENVTLVGGVAPTAVRFARYLRRKHKVYPKDLSNTQIVTLGSVHGVNTRYQPALHALYGPVAIRETEGGATERMFGQQRDEKKTWVPNVDPRTKGVWGKGASPPGQARPKPRRCTNRLLVE